MGYRSDVCGLIYGPPEKLDPFIVKMKIKGIYQRVNADGLTPLAEMNIKAGDLKYAAVRLFAENMKWYDGFDPVRAWVEMCHAAEDEELHYEFVRIGEDYTDIETSYSIGSENFLSVSRTICEEFVEDADGA